MDDTQTPTERQVRDERQAGIKQIVDALKVKYGSTQLFLVDSETADEFYVHRRAEPGERRIYRKLQADDKRIDASDSLMACVVWPEKDEFKKRLEQAPFVVETLENAILAASGVYMDVVRKKL
jgi:hypothetical protein